MRLPLRHIIHRNDRPKMCRLLPAVESECVLAPVSSREEMKLVALRPAFYLFRRDQELLVVHVAGLAVGTPIKSLKCRARLFVSRRPPKRCHPIRRHSPVVVVPRLALPGVQLRVSDAFAAQKPHG